MPNLYMLIGVPAAGKSTWTANLVENENPSANIHIASTDALIDIAARLKGKTYDEVFKDTVKDAEKAMYQMVIEAVKNNMDIVWDQTNLNRKTRAKKLIMIPDHYTKIAVYFPAPVDLNERLASRSGKTIPYHIMNSMIDNLEYPEYDEGFHHIIDTTEEE